MTRNRLYGISLLLLFIHLFLSSCSSLKKFEKYNFFNGSEFYNDSLNISGRFFGDIQFRPISEAKRNKFRKVNKLISYKNLLAYGKANTSPKYEVFLFYEKGNRLNIVDNKIIVNDSINNIVLFKKSIVGKTIFIMLKSIGPHKSNISIQQDAMSIITSMRFDDSIKKELTYSKIFNTYKDESNILYVLNKLNSAPIEQTKQNNWIKQQYLLTVLAMDGEYGEYAKMIENFEHNRKEYISNVLKNTNPLKTITGEQEIINEISRLSNRKRVIMLNEMHWKPEHRILAYKLLEPLKNEGFKYLAVEAIDTEEANSLNKRGFPIKSTGYYTREPFFGLFIRKAMALGYTIIGYDDFESDDREKSQANNIESLFDKDSTAKVYVYAGIDHILESSDSKTPKRMAEIFKEQTGIDPLTLDQVELTANSKNKVELYKSDFFGEEKRINANVDYFIVNNFNANLNELYSSSIIIKYPFKNDLLKSYEGEEVSVTLYFIPEYSKYKLSAIPIQNKIKKISNSGFTIDALQGSYYLLVKNKNNDTLIEQEINISF